MVAICPQLKDGGSCAKASCAYRHDIKICRPCGVVCNPAFNYEAHIRGKQHRRNAGGTGILQCPTCVVRVPESKWDDHLGSRAHVDVSETRKVRLNVEPQPAALMAGERHCAVCDVIVLNNKKSWAQHLKGRKHRNMEVFVAYRTAFEEAEQNRNGVIISHKDGVEFGVLEPAVARGGVELSLNVQNNVSAARIELVSLKVDSVSDRTPSFFTATFPSIGRPLRYDHPYTITVKFRHGEVGCFDDRLRIVFLDKSLNKNFSIVRPLRAVVGSQEDHTLFQPKAPYTSKTRRARGKTTKVVPGKPTAAANVIRWATRLPTADIPISLSRMLGADVPPAKLADTLRHVVLPSVLSCETYAKHFQTLLWVEEFQMQRDLESYDMTDAKLIQHGNYWHLEVPGLAENRPSVIVGDRFLVQRHGSPDTGHWFEGHVHFVRALEVGLKFHGSFQGHLPIHKYRVRLCLNRIPLRRSHQALSTVFNPPRILFPQLAQFARTPPSTTSIQRQVFNRLIPGNPQQLQAVASICFLPPGSSPFIVFGPPGTGKTVTIVEAIQQIIRAKPTARILACAPSNSATDLIAARLSVLGVDKLFRLYSPSRNKDQVPPEVLGFTHRSSVTEPFSVPPIAVVKAFKVIVTTCISAAVLQGVGIPRGHFSHIFIDEAGQCTEPESMIPIKTLAGDSTNVILSGDPKQLGPVIRSGVARALHFEISFLERLADTQDYDTERGHGRSIVKLFKNFRSHGSILHFPNEKFYHNQLKVCGPNEVINSFIGWPELPNKKFPVVFHAVFGEDQREAGSPSFFNVPEISLVKHYVRALGSNQRFRITDKEIGVIAGYNAQCARLRRALSDHKEIKVGSVEEFQGQERRVIILSTVRSSQEYLKYDLRHTLGFIASPRRLNVAVTRAQALLIIIGNPTALSVDPLWRLFLNYIHSNKGWKGEAPTWDTSEGVGEVNYGEEISEEAMRNMENFSYKATSKTLRDLLPESLFAADYAADANRDDRGWENHE